MDDIFNESSEVQSWLDFESALARAQAQVGLVPTTAAEEITRRARVENVSLEELRSQITFAVHPIVPVVGALAAICSADSARYVHWGATTQDVLDTGLMLRLKRAWELIRTDTTVLVETLSDLAMRQRKTVMPGRTHFQQGVPITFGYKMAVFVDELKRHLALLDHLAPTVFVGELGGATGTLAAMGSQGLAVRSLLMKELALGEPQISWHTARDRLVEVTFGFVLIAGTISRAAREIVHLQRTEIGEVSEPSHPGKVGSSTMPHKRNPAIAESLVTLGELVKNHLRTGLGSLDSLHERDKAVYSVENDYIPQTCCLLHRMLEQGGLLFQGLTVHAARMQDNIALSDGFAYSEAVMMKLADKIGHQRAHELVYNISMGATAQGVAFKEALLADSSVTSLLDKNDLEKIFQPAAVVGSAEEQVITVCGSEAPAPTGE